MNDRLAHLDSSRIALRLCFGLVPLLAGLDKFTNLLADWSQYLAPVTRSLLPVEPHTFLAVVGIVEIAVGIAVLTRWTAPGAYVATAWLALIALQLIVAGFFDVAVRDLVLAVAAFTLARLTEVHEAAAATIAARGDASRRAA